MPILDSTLPWVSVFVFMRLGLYLRVRAQAGLEVGGGEGAQVACLLRYSK